MWNKKEYKVNIKENNNEFTLVFVEILNGDWERLDCLSLLWNVDLGHLLRIEWAIEYKIEESGISFW